MNPEAIPPKGGWRWVGVMLNPEGGCLTSEPPMGYERAAAWARAVLHGDRGARADAWLELQEAPKADAQE
jgi:hypothetical protein